MSEFRNVYFQEGAATYRVAFWTRPTRWKPMICARQRIGRREFCLDLEGPRARRLILIARMLSR